MCALTHRTVLTVSGKPLKRLIVFCSVCDHLLKRGVNESLHLLGFNHHGGMNRLAARIERPNGNQVATACHTD